MQAKGGNLLRLQSGRGLFLLIKIVVLCVIPVVAWFLTYDAGITLSAAGLVAALSLVAFFGSKSVYKFYDDCLIINEERTANKDYEVSLFRIGNVTTAHNFLQARDTGNIFLVLMNVKQPGITERILGAKEIELNDNYPYSIVFMKNIKDYEIQAQLIRDIVAKAVGKHQPAGTPVLQGVTNVDEMLPWLGKNANER